MVDTTAPITCPECNVLPTQHICGSCKINYVCDICSLRRGVAEGIFRCHNCVPYASFDDDNAEVFDETNEEVETMIIATQVDKSIRLGDNIQEESAAVAEVVETEDNPATEEEVE